MNSWKRKKHFNWTNKCQQAFDHIKDLCIQPPVLHMPNPTGKFWLESDTSWEGVGGTLYQLQDDSWVLIRYHSKRLPDSVWNFGIGEIELTGLYVNIHGFIHILKNRYLKILVDHRAFEYLKNMNQQQIPSTTQKQERMQKQM